jgi:hypothetical protein
MANEQWSVSKSISNLLIGLSVALFAINYTKLYSQLHLVYLLYLLIVLVLRIKN